ncbi:MAG: hypothetical protein K1X29_04555 [Bdellovibrionales bacterium]|nr:hypothetical protein [Bdellovibrionales bacterium]
MAQISFLNLFTSGRKNGIVKVKSLQTSPGKTEGTPELNDLDSARYADAFKAWSKIAVERSVITRSGNYKYYLVLTR